MTAPSILACRVAVACGTVLALGCAEPTLRPTSGEGTRLPPGSITFPGFLDRSSGPWRFAGVVYQHTASGSSQPLAGLPLRVWEYPGPAIRFVTSDAEGRYDLLVGDTVKVEPAPETGYLAPCPAGTGAPNWTGGPRDFYLTDLHVVQETVLSTTGTPDMMRTLGLSLVGRVVGPAPSHDPIPGVRVELLLEDDGPVLSHTVSDATGRYLLCPFPPGSGTDQDAIVRVRKPGYRDQSVLSAFFGAARDIVLIPE